jgi:hypothetical protein
MDVVAANPKPISAATPPQDQDQQGRVGAIAASGTIPAPITAPPMRTVGRKPKDK